MNRYSKHTMDENYENCPKQPHLVDVMKIDENTQYLCPRCGFVCATADEYSQHLNEHKKSSNYNCHLCGRILSRHQQFCQHMKNHDKHMCRKCCATFSTRRLLLRHEQSAHGIRAEVSRSYICNICEKRFWKPNHLKIHMNTHIGVLPVKCNICDQSFPHNISLDRHMKSARHLLRVNFQAGKTLEVQKHYQCAECGSRFYRQQSLFRHLDNVHGKGESFKCSHCDYSTNCKPNLKRHEECHSDVKRFVCEVCGVAFRALSTLKEHQVFLHSEDRHFTCSVCDLSFKSKGILQRHFKTHSEDRPFECQTCSKKFKRLSHLKRHAERVHRKAPGKDGQPDSEKIKIKDSHVVSSSQNAEAMSIILFSNQNILSDELFIEEFAPAASNKNQHLNPTVNQEALSDELLVKKLTHPASNENQQRSVIPAVNQESLSDKLLVKEFTHPASNENQQQSFKSKSILQRHFKTHSEDRPFECQTCRKKFKRLSHLKCHVERVHRKASEKDGQPDSEKIKIKDGLVVSASQNAGEMSIILISKALSDKLLVKKLTHPASNGNQLLNVIPAVNQESLCNELLVKEFTHPVANENQQLNVIPAVNTESFSDEPLVKEFTLPVANENELLDVSPVSSVSGICNTDSHEMTKLIGMNSSSNLSSDPVSLCDLQLNKFCNLNLIPTQDSWTQTANDRDTQPKVDVQSVGVGTDPFPMHPDAGGLLSSLLDNSPSDDLSLGPSTSSKNIFEDCLPFSPGGGLAVYDDFAAQSPSGSDNMLFANESFMSEMTGNFVLG